MRRSFLASAVLSMAFVCGTLHAQAPAAAVDPFPSANPKYFDAASPTAAQVDGFLTAIWGYDAKRIWRVQAIQKTAAPGVSKVTIFVSDTTPGSKVDSVRFFVTPDGKFAIADTVFPFGANPYAANDAVLKQRADGPSKGAVSKAFEIVEFADLQCPHCKEAAPIIANLERDYPDAHIVYQNYPLTSIHPFAAKAAAYGNCVAAAKGSAAFFTYVQDVFDHQEALTAEGADGVMNAAATKAGASAASVAACAATPAAMDKVNAQIALGDEVGVDQTPMIAVNGHLLPLGGTAYETLKQVIDWDRKQSTK